MFMVWPISDSTSAGFVTSAFRKVDSPPKSLIISTVSAPPASSMSETMVFAPSSPNASAVALPIPDDAPVTRAVLPLKLLGKGILLYDYGW